MKSDVYLGLLDASTFFTGLDDEQRRSIWALATEDFAVAGDYVVHAGDESDCMFFVLSGHLQILTADLADGGEVIAELGRGEAVGEMGMITGARRSASVLAARDTLLARFSKAHFDALVSQNPQMLMRITKSLVERLGTRGPQTEVFRTLAVMPAGPDSVVGEFTSLLVESLERVGSCLHLTPQSFDEALGEGAAADDVDVWDEMTASTAAWLTDQEIAFDFLIFEADSEDTPWTRRCVRQADRVLLVGNAASDPALGPAERRLFEAPAFEHSVRADLVLLHADAEARPSGTRRWLEERAVARHHHVHMGTFGHIERVVRYLTNRSVGLVLGGGGAKGAAHAGVIQALTEAGIAIDMVGGTSSGAGVGALYAMGQCAPEIGQTLRQRFLEHRPFRRLTLPLVSLVSRRSVEATTHEMYGDVQMEDLWLPFFCISCNLSTGATVTHERGPVRQAVRASTALPGILPPVVSGDHVLVDGGIVDNVPVTEMKQLNAGPSIVVNVSQDVDLVLPEERGEFPSPWGLLRSWLNPFRKALPLPNWMSILGRVVLVNSVARKKQTVGMADFYLEPPLSGFGLMNPEHIDEMAGVAYEYTQREIDRWKTVPEAAELLNPIGSGVVDGAV